MEAIVIVSVGESLISFINDDRTPLPPFAGSWRGLEKWNTCDLTWRQEWNILRFHEVSKPGATLEFIQQLNKCVQLYYRFKRQVEYYENIIAQIISDVEDKLTIIKSWVNRCILENTTILNLGPNINSCDVQDFLFINLRQREDFILRKEKEENKFLKLREWISPYIWLKPGMPSENFYFVWKDLAMAMIINSETKQGIEPPRFPYADVTAMDVWYETESEDLADGEMPPPATPTVEEELGDDESTVEFEDQNDEHLKLAYAPKLPPGRFETIIEPDGTERKTFVRGANNENIIQLMDFNDNYFIEDNNGIPNLVRQ